MLAPIYRQHMIYIEPTPYAKSFTCPHCGTISEQKWWNISFEQHIFQDDLDNPIKVGTCNHCKDHTLWIEKMMYFPDNGNAPFPNSEMPENVKKLYAEAASIHMKSPRGAAAILRLALQLLCKELGEEGKNINKDIAELVKKGLPVIVQQSLDIVRVTGNDAVHPGQIDTDDSATVKQLFDLTNVIIEYMIALPKKVSGIYSTLPADKIKGIDDRDKS
jgi:hypothetical protein